MKVRKLAVALALAGGLGSGVAQALGLGEIELQSYLNEPLNADIDLRKSDGVSPNDVFVNIAPQSAYDRVGIKRDYFLTKLNFQVTTAPDGSLVVNVSSREPLREPYLNFLLEVTWPNGRLMREYAVLVDPPVYAEESGFREPVASPVTQQASQPAQQQTRRATQVQQPRTATTSTRTSGARTLGPTNSADTLWTIAEQIRPDSSVSMQQVMLAIQDLNPGAFIDGNINRLKRGEILRIPDVNQIQRRSKSQANQEVAVQNRAFSSPKPTVDATDSAPQTAGTGTSETDGDKLRLVTADEASSRSAEEGGSAGGDGDDTGGVDTGSAIAMEELESARRENEELTGRVDDLQDQVKTLQRLLELKNTQLAEMQDTDTATGEAETETEEPAESVADEAMDTEVPVETAESMDSMSGEKEADASSDMAAEAEEPEEQGAAESGVEEESAVDAESGMDDMAGMEDADGEAMAEAPVSEEPLAEQQDSVAAEDQPEPAAETTPPMPAEPEEEAAKPFPGNVIDAISNNFLYQIALGGGLVVLLLLLLALARRNANREKAFYDQLNDEAEDGEADSFDLSFDEEEAPESEESDALSEADAYIAYGRNDQAAQVLETAISREPSRTDLRLKLLGVYADSQDRSSFEKQMGEIEALDDEQAIAEARSLQSRLEEAESMPSIDDLESQLRSGGQEEEADADESDDELLSADDSATLEPEEDSSEEDEFGSDFEDMDLDLPESDDSASLEDSEEDDSESDYGTIEYDLSGLESEDDEDLTSELEGTDDAEDTDDFDFSFDEEGGSDDKSTDDDDLSLDFDTSDLGLDSEDSTEEVKASEADQPEDSNDELDDLSIDLDETDDASAKDDSAEKSVSEGEEDSEDALDESFLDELDAELDKVADEDNAEDDAGVSDLDDLELDVSDEDLALMEEFSETDDASPTDDKSKDDEQSLEDELGLEDALSGEEPADPEQEVEAAEELQEQVPEAPADPEDAVDADSADEDVPVASKSAGQDSSDLDLDESDLGDDDDFDFLAGTDEAATKLDLARAYVEMGDVDGARDILEEVALEGNDEQKAEAQDLLKNLS